MKNRLIWTSLLLAASCSEKQVTGVDPIPPPVVVPENPPQTTPPGTFDPMLGALSVTSIVPRRSSTVGGETVTINGTNFNSNTNAFFNGAIALRQSFTATQLVVTTPAGAAWGVPINVTVRRSTDNTLVANSNAAGSPTGFKFYAATIDYTERNSFSIFANGYTDPHAAMFGDFNGDGKPDILFNFANSNYSLWTNTGGGDFVNTSNSSMGASGLGTYKAIAIDLDLDGSTDVVESDAGSTWQYNIANSPNAGPSMNSRGQTGYNSGCSSTYAVAAAKVNADNYPDIAAVCYSSQTVGVWYNKTANSPGSMFGGTNAGRDVNVTLSGMNPTHVTFADLDQNGKQDMVVVVVNTGSPTLHWYLNTADTIPSNESGNAGINSTFNGRDMSPYWVTCGLLNNDAFPDCVVSDQGSYSVRVFLNNGAGVLQAPTAPIPVGVNPYEVTLDDANGDDANDILVANYGSHNVTILPNNGLGTAFGTIVAQDGRVLANKLNLSTSCRYPWSIKLVDIDGSGAKKMLTSCMRNERDENTYGGVKIWNNTSN